MKEIMLPYVLLIWILVKTGVIKWNLKNQFWSVAIGIFIIFLLFSASRFWAPIDLSNSSTVRAPAAILSPLFGQRIESIHVVHNQHVKKNDIIYTLYSDKFDNQIKAKDGEIAAIQSLIKAEQSELLKLKKDLMRHEKLGKNKFSSEQEIDHIQTAIQRIIAQVKSHENDIVRAEGQKSTLSYDQDLQTVRAPFDGMVSVISSAEGTRTGNISVYDTTKKFIEMRIPEQAYTHIKAGQFAEFYINTHPGQIFRARVHSKRVGTGEAAMSTRQGDRSIGMFVHQNAGSHGRTVILEFAEPEGVDLPIGATGSAWVSASKPYSWLGFMDVIGAAITRIKAIKAYFNAL